MSPRTIAAVEALLVCSARYEVFSIQSRPTGLACNPTFVADPPDVGTCIAEDACFRLQLTDDLKRSLPVVVCLSINASCLTRSAVEPVSAVCAVKEHFEDRTVSGQQLAKLIAKVVDVLATSVVLAVAVPRREIDPKLQSVSSTRIRDLAHYVSATLTPGAASHRMLGVLRGPKAKAVVVFARENQ